MKQVAGKLKLELAQFAELEAFSQFASDLDQATQNQLAQGVRLREMLKQAQNSPIPVEEQVAIIYAGVNGYLDDIEVANVLPFIAKLRPYLRNSASDFISSVKTSKKMDENAEELLKKAITEVKASM